MPSPFRARSRRLSAATGTALVGAATVAAGAVARALIRARPDPVPPAPSLAGLPATAPAVSVALDHLLGAGQGRSSPVTAAGHAQLGRDVAEAYRRARKAFGRAGEALDDEALTELHEATMVLWCCATVAEPFAAEQAKWLARRSRELASLLEEHRDLARLTAEAERHVSAVGPRALAAIEGHARRRRERLERRIRERGERLFAAKAGRVARRLADDAPHGDVLR